MSVMMSKPELAAHMDQLHLTQAEAAHLLSVNARTVRRWIENPAEMPGPAEQTLRAWLPSTDLASHGGQTVCHWEETKWMRWLGRSPYTGNTQSTWTFFFDEWKLVAGLLLPGV